MHYTPRVLKASSPPSLRAGVNNISEAESASFTILARNNPSTFLAPSSALLVSNNLIIKPQRFGIARKQGGEGHAAARVSRLPHRSRVTSITPAGEGGARGGIIAGQTFTRNGVEIVS